MKRKAKRKTGSPPNFEAEYRAAFQEYARRGGEDSLGRAYALGRRGIDEKKSLVELASLHHRTVLALLDDARGASRHQQLLTAAGEFLAETVSPYEMAHLGVQDAITALRQVNETLETEIKRVAYAVHDEAGQLLVAVHLALADLARELPSVQQDRVAQIEKLLKQVENHLRQYSHELRPTILDDLGWIPAIQFLAQGVSKRANLRIQIKTTVTGRLPPPIETALYRIVQEALANAAKHSKATQVRIRVGRTKGVLHCSIEDNGRGFDAPALRSNSRRNGLGLIAMQERLNGIGGTLSIDSVRGRGTRLLIQLPAEVSNANSNRIGG